MGRDDSPPPLGLPRQETRCQRFSSETQCKAKQQQQQRKGSLNPWREAAAAGVAWFEGSLGECELNPTDQVSTVTNLVCHDAVLVAVVLGFIVFIWRPRGPVTWSDGLG